MMNQEWNLQGICKMKFNIKLSDTEITSLVNFTVKIEAESEDEARELAVEDINSHEVISESTTDWDIEEVILESEEWYNNK